MMIQFYNFSHSWPGYSYNATWVRGHISHRLPRLVVHKDADMMVAYLRDLNLFIHSFIHSFVHSFILVISIAPLQVLYYTQRLSRLQHGYCIGVSSGSAQAIVGKGVAQGPYEAARAGVEPTTLRLKVTDSTKTPPRLLDIK